jgi:hypothetical protein
MPGACAPCHLLSCGAGLPPRRRASARRVEVSNIVRFAKNSHVFCSRGCRAEARLQSGSSAPHAPLFALVCPAGPNRTLGPDRTMRSPLIRFVVVTSQGCAVTTCVGQQRQFPNVGRQTRMTHFETCLVGSAGTDCFQILGNCVGFDRHLTRAGPVAVLTVLLDSRYPK